MTCVPLSLVLRQGLHCYSTVWRDWRVPCRMAVIASGLNRSSGLVPKLSLKINTATPFCDILWQTSGKVLENYESMSCGLQHAVWLRRNEVAFFDKTNFEPLSNSELWNVNIRKAMLLNRRLALNLSCTLVVLPQLLPLLQPTVAVPSAQRVHSAAVGPTLRKNLQGLSQSREISLF